MPDWWLPHSVVLENQKREWVEARARHRAVIERLMDFDDPVCREWTPELQRLCPDLRMGRARPQAYEPGYTIIPGFYHWVRDNVSTADSVQPITAPDGVSFEEPTSAVLEDLRRNDLQNPHVYAALINRHVEVELERERQEQEDHQERVQEVLDRWKSATGAQVLMSPDVPWSQNTAGRRGVKRCP